MEDQEVATETGQKLKGCSVTDEDYARLRVDRYREFGRVCHGKMSGFNKTSGGVEQRR